MRVYISLLLLCGSMLCRAQQSVTIEVKNAENERPVSATVLVKGKGESSITVSNGRASIYFPANGNYTLMVTAIGFQQVEKIISIPYQLPVFEIQLQHEEEEMEEIIVQSTRTGRTIANVPTRVEVIDFEEIDEKNNMRPANVAMLLHESTGIQVQQTSATSGNASIRIQGLDGRYTQLLKDGFANFGNFSSGLSVLEIPPLDLKQVEIIKGPASTLYGGGAIAGVINFISKTPGADPEYSLLINQSNIGQRNIGGFASGRNKKAGFTMLALYNTSKAYDVDEDGFSEVPLSDDITFNPKLFLYPNESTTISFGHSASFAERTGGDMVVLNDKADSAHQYFEKNETSRNISTFELDKALGAGKKLVVKQSLSFFDRSIRLSDLSFSGDDLSAFSDLSYVSNAEQHSWVFGANYIYNRFNEQLSSSADRDNVSRTIGAYGQHTWDASDNIKLESGLRLDRMHNENSSYKNTEWFLLPRVSLLVKYSPKWSSRFGGGLGYKAPTLFTEETESIQYRRVKQLNNVTSERSYGSTVDVNFKTAIAEDWEVSFNQLFFYTRINNPLVLQKNSSNEFVFSNAASHVRSTGFETNARIVYKENFKLFAGYTYTNAVATYRAGNPFLPLVPRHKLNSALIYEKEGVIKLGLEGYFTGRQFLSDGTVTPAYKELGFMAEKLFKHFSLFINFENFTDTRQSRYKPVVSGDRLNPRFDEIWNHTEGFVWNGGIKLKW